MANEISFDATKHFLKQEWQSIRIDKKDFMFKSVFETFQYEILLLDLNKFRLYYLKNTEKEINDLFKSLNPTLETTTNKIAENVKKNFTSSNELSIQTESNEKLVIKLVGKLATLKFNWEFEFKPILITQIREHLILPLIFNLGELQTREAELVKIIQAKDREIDDYKSQGAKMSRSYQATDAFNLEYFEEKLQSKENNNKTIIDEDNPFLTLQTSLFKKTNEICLNKYYTTYFKLNEQSSYDEQQSSFCQENGSQSLDKLDDNKPSQSQTQSQSEDGSNEPIKKQSRLDELDVNLKKQQELEAKKSNKKVKKLLK